ncbi:MAG: CDP-diacylglycerol--glycerol-3-phosphate 3-phosphatidyltransferase [Spirochaetia bacterium]|nr:CDP-diacylglycerol--glycerol-3-phosphate 3-phosphatidyltransferase [Spirochaetia bacterium]
MQYLPNLLTILRLILTPVLLYFLLSEGSVANQILRVAVIVLIYVVATLTDYYDGYFSRKYHVVSRFGEFLDPLADKFLILAVFVAFIYLGFVPVPAILIILIAIREVLITAVRIRAIAVRLVMKTEKHGKIKTVIQIVSQSIVWFVMLVYAIVTVTPGFASWYAAHSTGSLMASVHPYLMASGILIDPIPQVLHFMPLGFIAVACAVTLYSGYAYLRGNWALIFGGKNSSKPKKTPKAAAKKKSAKRSRSRK